MGLWRTSVVLLLIGWPVMAERASSQVLEPRPLPQRRIESYSFRSSIMDRPYNVSVGLPIDYEPGSAKQYPALLVTDGDQMFPIVAGIADGLMGQGTIEPLFAISVSTPIELGDTAWVSRRIYEFSGPGWAMEDEFGKLVWSYCQRLRPKEPKASCTGGAPRFLHFIAAELLPALEAKYRIDKTRWGLYGISAGGFFAAYTIFQAESPFTTYILSSPAMAYGDGEIFRHEARYAEEHKDLPIGLYMGSGSLEMDDPFLEGVGRIVSGQSHLAGALATRHYPGLRLYVEIHQGLSHFESGATSLARGLRLLYPKKP